MDTDPERLLRESGSMFHEGMPLIFAKNAKSGYGVGISDKIEPALEKIKENIHPRIIYHWQPAIQARL